MATVDVYVRVSRRGAREDERFHAPAEQERDARAFAERRGLRVGEVYKDIDRSGGTLDRPGLQKALERVRSGQSAGIVVAYLSRLSRETSQGLALLEEIRSAGGEVYAPNLSDHTTADGRMLNTIQLAIDAGMRERAREQIARSREGAIEAGIPVTNRAAVGYRRDPETRRYVRDPAVAPVIREVFERRAAGAGSKELAELLEAHGIRTSMGSTTWSRPALAGLLRSRTYLGEIRSGPYVNATAHDPIVDEATFLAAQKPKNAPRRGRPASYLLTGVLRCQACGYSMQGTRTSRGKRIYRCLRRHAGGICPAPARIDADQVEEAVLEQLRGKLYLPREKLGGVDLAPLQGALDAADKRLEQVLGADMQDALGDRWPAVVRERRTEREEAALALGQARAEAGVSERRGSFWDSMMPFEEFDPDLQRWAIRDVFPAIAVYRDKRLDFNPDTSDLTRRGYKREPKLNPLKPSTAEPR